MNVNDFYNQYHQKVIFEARDVVRMYKVPRYLEQDCVNAGYLAICKYIHKWDPLKGANPMSYLRPSIRNEMASVCRSHLHHTPCNFTTKAIPYVESLNSMAVSSDCDMRLASWDSTTPEADMDGRDVLTRYAREYPKQMSRLMAMTFDYGGGSRLAETQGCSRQAIAVCVREFKAKIRRECVELEMS